MTSTFFLVVLQWDSAFVSRHATKIETFNECMMIVLLYTFVCFSDFVDSPETRDYIGWAYIAAMSTLTTVHLFFLFSDMLKKLKLRLVRQYRICKYRTCRKQAPSRQRRAKNKKAALAMEK